MAFIEVRFPADIAYGSAGGPEYSTEVVITHSGYEQRNSNWAQARARYNVAHGLKTQAQLDTLIAFFRARKGRADGFRFKDWTDYQASGQLIGTGNGSNKVFQLCKAYNSGGSVEQRVVSKPVAGTVKIYVAGVLQSVGAYTIALDSGVLTFGSAPSAGLAVTADFEFDVPVRFDTDRLSASIDAYGSHSWTDIPLVEIRV